MSGTPVIRKAGLRAMPSILAMALSSPVAAASASVALRIADGSLSVSQHRARIWLTLRHRDGAKVAIALPPDADIQPGTFEDAKLVARPDPNTLVLETRYMSQTGRGGPLAQCAAGEETILRVVRLRPTLQQTASLLTGSCWHDAYLGNARWDDATRTLRMSDDQTAIFTITPDGRLVRAP